jgi:hypothetical protein
MPFELLRPINRFAFFSDRVLRPGAAAALRGGLVDFWTPIPTNGVAILAPGARESRLVFALTFLHHSDRKIKTLRVCTGSMKEFLAIAYGLHFAFLVYLFSYLTAKGAVGKGWSSVFLVLIKYFVYWKLIVIGFEHLPGWGILVGLTAGIYIALPIFYWINKKLNANASSEADQTPSSDDTDTHIDTQNSHSKNTHTRNTRAQ